MKAVGLKISSGSFSGGQMIFAGPEKHSVLRARIAKRRERTENSEAIKQFRSMRTLSEFTRAHRKMDEPKTLGQLLAEEAKEKLDAAKKVFAGVTLPV
jgi:hypothetical protein